MIKALLAEDESMLAEILKENLAERNIDLTIAKDGEEALNIYRKQGTDILITDIRMPKMDGLTLIRHIRKDDENLPIIITTVNAETDDLEEGFDAGADDYLRKPFSIRELALRIKALTRRTNRSLSSQDMPDTVPSSSEVKDAPISRTLNIGDYTLNIPAQQLIQNKKEGASVRSLSFRETAILECLISADGEIVENTRLLKDFWGDDDPYNLNSLYVFINRLKRYLSDDPHIQFVNARGIGYRLICQ